MFCSKSFVKTALFFVFFFTITDLSFFFQSGKFLVLNLIHGTKKKQTDLSFPSSSFFDPYGAKMWCIWNVSALKLTTILVLPHNLWPTALYPFLCTTFLSSRFRISHYLPFGGWQVCKGPLNALHSVRFFTSMAHLVKGTV